MGLLTATAPASQAAVFHCPTSTVCVHANIGFGGSRQDISGFAAYTDLNGQLHDKASSWVNANRWVSMGIGEWRNGKQFIGQVLPAGWYENNLHTNANFGDKADFVKQV
ncbi:peptidase inhibitor family I36 protein [Rothia nasisuis]|uniref:peptidase inhibitor family I36 protein n=1 Tax=Rothia nasisuis TaxID=2109647 RepID=UPI0023510CAC|nr:peptidase inhibitor family I36 protein [Rothia nasisuis]